MPEYRDHRSVPHTPAQLFDVVLDVARYHAFLPWCVASEVLEVYPGENKFYASMAVGFGLYNETYVSKVTYEKDRWIAAHYVDGPFQHLETRWDFTPTEAGCDLTFYVSFAFEKSVMNAMASHVLDHVSSTMVEAFLKRAQEKYSG